ncbi:unnamed protein product, partial [Callosobruchus maculatus]
IHSRRKTVERFWKFLLPSGHDSNAISACILNEISLLVDDPEKLIAQSYDGAAVMSGAINGVHKHVQERYPRANFVHCYAHQANLIMSHATSSNSDCRIFFANLTGLCTFFSTSPQRAARLEEFLHKKGLPRSSKIKWNFNSRTVNAVYDHREDIIGALEKIEREATSQTTIQQAGANLRILEDESFIYWLTFFHKIMPHVDILFNQLPKVTTDALKIHSNIGDFERAIGKIRSEIGNTETQTVDQNNSELTPPPSKRRRTADKSERRRQSIEVCDNSIKNTVSIPPQKYVGTACRKIIWHLSIKQLGWDSFIVAPANFKASDCFGNCALDNPIINHKVPQSVNDCVIKFVSQLQQKLQKPSEPEFHDTLTSTTVHEDSQKLQSKLNVLQSEMNALKKLNFQLEKRTEEQSELINLHKQLLDNGIINTRQPAAESTALRQLKPSMEGNSNNVFDGTR